ncbi:MAG: hypothetical protein KGM42_15160 [Hyphomicrobiales bacterium]|nr:hypothetical protein [Hyphomicrobiales bacterium]
MPLLLVRLFHLDRLSRRRWKTGLESESRVPRVIMPLPRRDFDASEAAVSWRVLSDLGDDVVFAMPDGAPAANRPAIAACRRKFRACWRGSRTSPMSRLTIRSGA